MADPARKRATARSGKSQLTNPATRKPRARGLRRRATDAEQLLWSRLRGRRMLGRKFRRQVPVGRYIVDFVSVQDRLIIEADGGQHGDQAHYDSCRTELLEAHGYRVLRFWNNEILTELDSVLEQIRLVLMEQDGGGEEED